MNLKSKNNQINPGEEFTNSIESVNEDETLTDVQIVGKNKVGKKRFDKTKTKLKQHKLSTSEKIPDGETKNRRRKKKQYLKEKSPNPTGKTYSNDFSINMIGPDSIHPSTAGIVTSDQRKTSTDPVTSQEEDDDKLQDSLPKGSPTVMSRIQILGDEYAEGFIKVMTLSIDIGDQHGIGTSSIAPLKGPSCQTTSSGFSAMIFIFRVMVTPDLPMKNQL
ncbi:hypothetical protein JTB14_020151 [Gonioctena quinquepunctata]|nr:hypothetical protein JTB14_020151 [Gonioctena quinquepunctata]